MRRYYFTHFNLLPTDGEGTDTTTTNQPTTFTQEQVNQLLAQETAKVKKERDATVTQLEALKKSQGLTAKEKEALQTKIDELTSLNMSKEQQAQLEADRLKKTFEDEKGSIVSERDHWKDQYSEYRRQTEILSVASTANAYNPQQLVELLLPKTKLIEQKENVNGQEKITYTPIVKFADRDKDGKPITLDLSVGDAVKRMKEMPETFGNLFKSDTKGGTGLLNSSQSSGGNRNGFRRDMSQEEYDKFRKERGFGSKIR